MVAESKVAKFQFRHSSFISLTHFLIKIMSFGGQFGSLYTTDTAQIFSEFSMDRKGGSMGEGEGRREGQRVRSHPKQVIIELMYLVK